MLQILNMMIGENVHNALREVRELRNRILERQLFQGFSGVARALGGFAALLGCLVMALPFYPGSPFAHLAGWGTVCVVSVLMNYGALFLWYSRLRGDQRGLLNKRAVLDTLVPVVMGGVITLGLIQTGTYDLLFGVWMIMFGLMNFYGRNFLPRSLAFLGLYYMACGSYFMLFRSEGSFFNPWPMGLVFFIGECAGGYIFFRHSATFRSEGAGE